MMAAILWAVLMASADGAAAATEGAQPLAPGERRVKAICRTEAPTGTRFPRRRCFEQETYDGETEAARATFQTIQGWSNTGPQERVR